MKMSGASNNAPSTTGANNSQQWARDYPEPHASAFDRYLAGNQAAWDAQHPEAAAASPPESPSPTPEQAEDPDPDSQPGGLEDLQRYDMPGDSAARNPSSGPAGLATPKKPFAHSTPSSTPKRVKIGLQVGFGWNRESLALLCRWKDRLKKGSQVAIDAGAFPGHTAESIDAVWNSRRAEARQAYQELYIDK